MRPINCIKLLMIALLGIQSSFAQNTTPKICYEIFIRSFADSNGDGIGDINGITTKLDYLKNLGVDAVWITPISKSPSYHKYDVTDYKSIDPECGTIEDYKRLIAEAHKRNILIIKDLVVNHTSSQHPWFQEASKGKDNPYRDYYVWMTPKKIDSLGIARREADGGSWELNPWHFVRPDDDEKYYGLFWGGMPDLNFDNPKVRQEIFEIGQYWLKEVGVDGFRLDAAKHIYPEWEAEKCHQFWAEFKAQMQSAKPNVMLVGEVWAKADIVAPYFKSLNSNFNIDLAHGIHKAVGEGKDDGLIKKLIANYEVFKKSNPDFIDATIIDNHDQNRIASILNGEIAKTKAAANLLLTLPGQPYIYYGEELGMLGTKPDENIREAFLWDTKPNDKIRTNWLKGKLFSTDETIKPLSIQSKDVNSVYNHYKTLIALRKSQPALWQIQNPNIEAVETQKEVIAFIRPHQTGDLLVVHNISPVEQVITLPKKFQKVIYKTEPYRLNGEFLVVKPYSMVVMK